MQAQGLMNENTGTGPGTPPAARNYTIEFWRFVFASLVFYLHYEVYIYMHWASVSGIPGMTRMFEGAYVAVEFFFILSGFLLARSAEKKGLGEANWKTSGQI